MWVTLISVLISTTKWIIERRAAKKLSDVEFLAHIEAHQKRRAGVGAQAINFENSMQDAYAELEKEKQEKKP